MTDATASLPITSLKNEADRLFARKRLRTFGIPAVILAYLVYVFFAFDVPGLADRMRLDNAATLVSDSYSYKTQVTRDNRSGNITVAKEGERKGAYPDGMTPDWVELTDGGAVVDLPDGHRVLFGPDNSAVYMHPTFGEITAQVSRTDGVTLSLPEADLPDWISYSKARLDIRTDAGRLTMTRSKTEVFRYFFGWELFWFTLDSPYHDKSLFQILFGPQLDETRSNIAGAWQDFWNNAMWRHKDVVWALGETVLMAFLGTMGAAMIALPLAFIAAKNFTPLRLARQVARRFFDFVRGVDALIWTIVLSRAFGPGSTRSRWACPSNCCRSTTSR